MTTPIHPAIVHVPLGLSVAIPLLAIGLMVWLWRGRGNKAVWLVVIALQILVVGGGLLALRTGESDEERVERVVGERPLEAHEVAGKQFVATAAIALLASVIVLLPRVRSRGVLVVAVLATFATAAMAIHAGKGGGELVYVHGAAQTHVGSGALGATPGGSTEERTVENDSETHR